MSFWRGRLIFHSLASICDKRLDLHEMPYAYGSKIQKIKFTFKSDNYYKIKATISLKNLSDDQHFNCVFIEEINNLVAVNSLARLISKLLLTLRIVSNFSRRIPVVAFSALYSSTLL